VLIEGQLNGKEVVLNTIGADMARGSLTGSALRNADGSWIIDTMRLNEIRLQSDKTLTAFFAPLATILSADWSSGRDRRPASGPGLGGDRPRFKPAQPDAEQR
jgi:hypothetical protein